MLYAFCRCPDVKDAPKVPADPLNYFNGSHRSLNTLHRLRGCRRRSRRTIKRSISLKHGYRTMSLWSSRGTLLCLTLKQGVSKKRIDSKYLGRTRAERERPDSRPSNKAQAFYMYCELLSSRLTRGGSHKDHLKRCNRNANKSAKPSYLFVHFAQEQRIHQSG